MKSLSLDAWKLELHDNNSFESQWIDELDRQPALTHVLHPSDEGLPKRILKTHRQINVVSEIPATFAFHLGNGDV